MESRINGLHHITALAAHPQENYDFYTRVLGMRLVKKTVNFDAPDVYHLYFADEIGTPGTVLTFFPFPNASRGVRGAGEASAVLFAVPRGSLSFWIDRLRSKGIEFRAGERSFGREYIGFEDPEGMRLEIVEDDVAHLPGWETEDVTREHSLRKFFGTRVLVSNDEGTKKLIVDDMGFEFLGREGALDRYTAGEGDHRVYFDVEVDPKAPRARQSAGSIHHIAWRTENDESQQFWLQRLRSKGYSITSVIDRNYFHSVYYREPGGVLFEIATDNPGFTVDEALQELGMNLKLPSQYEPHREQIEKVLIPLDQRQASTQAAEAVQ